MKLSVELDPTFRPSVLIQSFRFMKETTKLSQHEDNNFIFIITHIYTTYIFFNHRLHGKQYCYLIILRWTCILKIISKLVQPPQRADYDTFSLFFAKCYFDINLKPTTIEILMSKSLPHLAKNVIYSLLIWCLTLFRLPRQGQTKLFFRPKKKNTLTASP